MKKNKNGMEKKERRGGDYFLFREREDRMDVRSMIAKTIPTILNDEGPGSVVVVVVVVVVEGGSIG